MSHCRTASFALCQQGTYIFIRTNLTAAAMRLLYLVNAGASAVEMSSLSHGSRLMGTTDGEISVISGDSVSTCDDGNRLHEAATNRGVQDDTDRRCPGIPAHDDPGLDSTRGQPAQSEEPQTEEVRASDILASTAMVVTFVFLPFVVRVAFGMFTCIALDQPVSPPYIANAVGSFWSFDTNQLCYEGYHRAWAQRLGVPLVCVLCIVLPLAVFLLVFFNRQNLNKADFRRHYGFLYRDYKPSMCCWEAILMIETITLVAVSVFGFTLGPYYQALVMNAALAFIGGLLLLFEPYAHKRTERFARGSVGCCLIISYVALSFLSYGDVQPDPKYGLVMGGLLLGVNAVYMGLLLWQLLVHDVQWRYVKGRAHKVARSILQKVTACC